MSRFNPAILWNALVWLVRGAWRNTKRLIPRAYAFALAFVICYLTYQAIAYLIIGLLSPAAAPEQITQLPRRMDASLLADERHNWRALDAAERPRTPPAHFHRIDGWIRPDRFNGCTTSGCHSSMPHNERKEVRAFLNMHASSIHCGVCHMQSDESPLALTWYDLKSAEPKSAPAILQAFEMLVSPDHAKRRDAPDGAFQSELVSQLRASARDADNLTALTNLADHFAAVRPDSREFRDLLVAARSVLPRHFRGEYGAKLALRDPAGSPVLAHPDSQQAVDNYLAREESLKGQDRLDALDRVHTRRRSSPLDCSACHRQSDALINFADIGYPAERIRALRDPVVVEMIEHIRQGTPFHMPGFFDDTH